MIHGMPSNSDVPVPAVEIRIRDGLPTEERFQSRDHSWSTIHDENDMLIGIKVYKSLEVQVGGKPFPEPVIQSGQAVYVAADPGKISDIEKRLTDLERTYETWTYLDTEKPTLEGLEIVRARLNNHQTQIDKLLWRLDKLNPESDDPTINGYRDRLDQHDGSLTNLVSTTGSLIKDVSKLERSVDRLENTNDAVFAHRVRHDKEIAELASIVSMIRDHIKAFPVAANVATASGNAQLPCIEHTEIPAIYESDADHERLHDWYPVFVGPNHRPECKWETCKRCGITRKPSKGIHSYLMYSNLDDQPITEEWLVEIGLPRLGSLNDGIKCFGPQNGPNIVSQQDGKWITSHLSGFMSLETRRDVRLLCELLRIELKEPS